MLTIILYLGLLIAGIVVATMIFDEGVSGGTRFFYGVVALLLIGIPLRTGYMFGEAFIGEHGGGVVMLIFATGLVAVCIQNGQDNAHRRRMERLAREYEPIRTRLLQVLDTANEPVEEWRYDQPAQVRPIELLHSMKNGDGKLGPEIIGTVVIAAHAISRAQKFDFLDEHHRKMGTMQLWQLRNELKAAKLDGVHFFRVAGHKIDFSASMLRTIDLAL